jgi:hypothetical protein
MIIFLTNIVNQKLLNNIKNWSKMNQISLFFSFQTSFTISVIFPLSLFPPTQIDVLIHAAAFPSSLLSLALSTESRRQITNFTLLYLPFLPRIVMN